MNDSQTAPRLTDDDLGQLMADAEDLNGSYPDAVLFLARYAGGHSEATEAEITGVDDSGVILHVRIPGSARERAHLEFDEPPSEFEQARASLHGLFAKARTLADDGVPLNSLEREIDASTRLTTFETSVVEVEDLTPHMRQITFGGGLDDFTPIAPDQYLLVTPEHTSRDQISPSAYYTVRRWRPDEVDMWFVLHDHGPISAWAASAEPGAKARLWGPRSSFRPPTDTTRLLLVADDTGLPAIAAILESNRDIPARVIVETHDANRVDLDTGPEVSIDWLSRGNDPPGTGTRLLDSVRRHALDIDGLYAFGAAESRQISAVRKHLRHEQGMRQSDVQMTGYWRRQTVRSITTNEKEKQ